MDLFWSWFHYIHWIWRFIQHAIRVIWKVGSKLRWTFINYWQQCFWPCWHFKHWPRTWYLPYSWFMIFSCTNQLSRFFAVSTSTIMQHSGHIFDCRKLFFKSIGLRESVVWWVCAFCRLMWACSSLWGLLRMYFDWLLHISRCHFRVLCGWSGLGRCTYSGIRDSLFR